MNLEGREWMQPSNHPKHWSWHFWPAVPLYPYGKRRTICAEIVKDTIWTFDQLQGILYTVVPIRMTVVKLAAGGLLVYAPVAPTGECVGLVNELVKKHGDVKYIILPTSSGLEHKVFVGPFARCFPRAQVFVAPHQWSFPFNLPLSWLGFPPKRTQVLPQESSQSPFADEFDYHVLDIDLGRGCFAEVAFFHKRSHTLLLTDSIISVPEEPPAITQLDPYPLLFHARDHGGELMADHPENRRKGWQRISLFAVYFRPHALEMTGLQQMLGDAFKAPDHSPKAYFGLYPFRWRQNWQQSFHTLRSNGRVFVAPILQILIFPQAPRQVLTWADQIAGWDFRQIIPCHFDSPIQTSPDEFRQAFHFLEKQPAFGQDSSATTNQPLSEEDMQFIRELEAGLVKQAIAKPPQEKI
ncbi:DUF4336 domain-containing protein [Umezakia ovalisporum]|uniref:DUF4336 domain-containing protein n=1 Tax=Umezakia ovalisporum FSS-43 TaxID=2740520 RepID=A0ABT6K553_9CYAN|nr:DUF4336 domain-containing protein [Umezakia ovalisporum]MDH6057459.1 DUF4336 domain-containing protein [Umezakia ovalisporum FSS-43]MDH6070849.1 DUF4336 domain-containing protein [Umezakia ovalisporum CobakiLakeA]MDH6074967.1 DUF4336 domain-containing protein [Umezakia ovalisporum CS-1034]MDH6077453.1 DUF4336 domain-containing protein [Umezakia ovalisporum FSS-45]MDH6082487.1 DUF4336 domain-containing protein [Umezakia ovalisporum FSS-44]